MAATDEVMRILDNVTIARRCKRKTAVKMLASGIGIEEGIIWQWLSGLATPSPYLLGVVLKWAREHGYDAGHLDLFG